MNFDKKFAIVKTWTGDGFPTGISANSLNRCSSHACSCLMHWTRILVDRIMNLLTRLSWVLS